MEELQNNLTKGNDNYHANTTEVYNLLINYKTAHSKLAIRLVDNSEEVLFAKVEGNEGKSNSYKSGVGGG